MSHAIGFYFFKKQLKEKNYKEKIEGFELCKLAEEHGYVKISKNVDNLFSIWQKIELLPTHGCTTINLHDVYYGIRSGIVECVLPIEGRGKFY